MLLQLPQEILIEILVRLPVKSLLRFQVVSRSWNSLIKSKTFKTQHLSRSVKASDFKIFLRHYDITRSLEIYTFYHDDGKCLTEDQVLKLPTKKENYYYAGACNGLLCLSDSATNYLNIVLWNPSIRTSFDVPFPRFIGKSQICLVGLGFGSLINQYKVLRLIYVQSRKHKCMKKLEVEVFVLGTGKWRRLDIHVPLMELYCICPYQAFLHGAIHWVGLRPDNSSVIIVFDVHEEVLREIEIPSIAQPNDCWFSMGVCVESLCVLEHDPGIGGETSRVFIWVMEMYGVKESWTKLFSVNMQDQSGPNSVLGFRNNGKLLVLNEGKGLVSYDSKSGKIEQPRIHGKNHEIFFSNEHKELASFYLKNGMVEEELGLIVFFNANPHIECLVLLEGVDGVEGQLHSCSLTDL